MKRKISVLFYVGLCLNLIGFAASVIFENMQHNWIPIPIFIVGSILLLLSTIKGK